MSIRLLLPLLALGGLAWLGLAERGEDGPPPAPVLPAGAVPVIPALPPPPAGPWAEQVERPLFVPGRRPPEVAAPLAEASEPEPEAPAAALGVVLREGRALALLRLADGRSLRVAVGEAPDGWEVVRITGEEVELRRGARSLTLGARLSGAEGLRRVD